ncbi:MAG TPA: CHRD domain-containing protein [Vicinamibacterales bacterium]|nr:CHRD domain-containing protein [Vicinamibacterales bacterium]
MTRVAAVLGSLGLLAGVAACGSSSPSTNPSPTPYVFTAQLLPANELGNINGGETSGSGTVTVTMNTTRDAAGNLTTANATFDVTISGFPSTTNITLAHIHVGASGVNGGIVVSTTIASGDVTLTNGAGAFQKLNLNIQDLNLANQIINNPAGYYFNVHTTANPGGVMRGQLVRVQ